MAMTDAEWIFAGHRAAYLIPVMLVALGVTLIVALRRDRARHADGPKCSSCGKQNRTGASYCRSCGQLLPGATSAPPVTPVKEGHAKTPAESRRRSRGKRS